MISKIFRLLGLLLLISSASFCQNDGEVFMKWKLKPGESIRYGTVMEEIDTANHKDFSMNGLPKEFKDADKSGDIQKILKQLAKQTQLSNFVTSLTKDTKGLINIEMRADDKQPVPITDTGEAGRMQSMMAKMMQGVTLRGSIREDGTIQSFYTKSDQKNLIAVFFELPGRPVKEGDSWPVDVHFLSMDQNFKCDSSVKRNNVKVVAIKNIDLDQLVTLHYDIEEYIAGKFTSPFDNKDIPTTMKMTHVAEAVFSIKKGRWLSYNGVMSLKSTGISEMQTTKQCLLTAE